MAYDPSVGADNDFEIGSFWDKIVGGIDKTIDYTFVKPTAMIAGAIGGKGAAKAVEKFGDIQKDIANPGRLFSKKNRGVFKMFSGKKHRGIHSDPAHHKLVRVRVHPRINHKSGKCSHSSNQQAASIAAMLVKTLGGPLNAANHALQLSSLQRRATYEHNKLMQDADFRKKVLRGIATLAAQGNAECDKTIKVMVGH